MSPCVGAPIRHQTDPPKTRVACQVSGCHIMLDGDSVRGRGGGMVLAREHPTCRSAED